MSNYKDFAKEYIGESDIATLLYIGYRAKTNTDQKVGNLPCGRIWRNR